MSIKAKYILVLLSIIFFTNNTSALTLHISPLGDNKNDGSTMRPLASLAGARDRIRSIRKNGKSENITVIIKAGNYFFNEPVLFTEEDGGLNNTSVLYKAEANATPIFYGGKKISGFQKVNDSLWKVVVPGVKEGNWNFEQLFMIDSYLQRARSPNEGFFHPTDVSEAILKKGSGPIATSATQEVNVSAAEKKMFDRIPADEIQDVIVTFYHKWDNTRKRLLAYSSRDTAFTIKGTGMIPWNSLDKKSFYTIENVKSALDAPGEWYLERKTGTLYYVPRKGESPANTTVYAPVAEKILLIQGTKENRITNLYFENICFRVAGYTMPLEGNEPVQAAATVEAVVMVDYAKNVSFSNCEFAYTGSSGIWFHKDCSDCKVFNCYLHDLGAGGIKIGEINHDPNTENTKRITIDNNIIRHGGSVFPCAVAVIIFTGSDNVITHNEIADFRYSGISAGWVWGYKESFSKRNKISFNHIHHLGWGELSDMGGVYTLGPSEGTEISDNVIHDIYSNEYGGWGLYTDEGSTGITIENNLVYNCKSSAFHQHYGKDNVVRNNIFYNQIVTQLEVNSEETHSGFSFTNNIIYYGQGNLANEQWERSNFSTDYNSYWDTRTKAITIGTLTFKQWQNTGKDIHSIIADPGFVNVLKYDFRITNNGLLKTIGFKVFDYSKAGISGSVAWRKKAIFDVELSKRFNEIIKKGSIINNE